MREDFVLSLRERTQSKLKCHKVQSAQSPSEGVIVLIKDEIPRGCLKIAKVISLATSLDEEIRSAKVQLSSGPVIGCPLNLLFPLEISEKGSTNSSQNESSATKLILLDVRPKRSTIEIRCAI